MPDLQDIQKALEALAAPLSGRDGFHLGMRDNPNAVELEYGQMLYGAVLDKKPNAVVEIGTGPGYSATWILLAMEKNQKGHLWTIDPIQPHPAVWSEVECPTQRLTAITELCRPMPKAIPKVIDVLFHDGSHDWYNDIVHDFDLYLPRIRLGGVALLHDVVYRDKMGEQARLYYEAREDEWSFQEVSMGCGMLIATRVTAFNHPKRKKKGVIA